MKRVILPIVDSSPCSLRASHRLNISLEILTSINHQLKILRQLRNSRFPSRIFLNSIPLRQRDSSLKGVFDLPTIPAKSLCPLLFCKRLDVVLVVFDIWFSSLA